MPNDFSPEQQTQTILEDLNYISGQGPIRFPPQIGNVYSNASTWFKFAHALSKHIQKHLEILNIVGRNMTITQSRLILLASEVRRRCDDKGN
jgi:hypothetical protein